MGIAGVRPGLGFLGFSARGPEGFFAPRRGALNEPPSAAGIAGSRPGLGFLGFSARGPEGFFAPCRGALNEPPSAAGIAGSRPGRRADFLRAQEVGGRRALKGGSLEEDGGAKLAPLENPPSAHVQPDAGRRLMLALSTTAIGRLAGDTRRKTTPVPGVRALCARARRSRAVFRLPVGAARHAKAAVPPHSALPVRSRRLAGRGIAPAARRLTGCCRLVRSSVTGRRRLWPKANRWRRGGRWGAAPCGFFPLFLGRPRNRAARRGGTRQISAAEGSSP